MMATRDAAGRFVSTVWDQYTEANEMTWSVVSSSNVSAVGYNPGTHTLGVSFLNGTSYEYDDVDEPIYEALRTAQSVGGFLARFIKGHYSYRRVV